MNLIHDPQRLWRYLAGIAHAKGILLIAAGGTVNHVHLLLDLPTTMQVSLAAPAPEELEAARIG